MSREGDERAYALASSDYVLGISGPEFDLLRDLLSHDTDLLAQVLGYTPTLSTVDALRRELEWARSL